MPTLAEMMRGGKKKRRGEPWRQDIEAELGAPDRSNDDAYFAELMAQQQAEQQPQMHVAQEGGQPPQAPPQQPPPLAQMMQQGMPPPAQAPRRQMRQPAQQMPQLPMAARGADARARRVKSDKTSMLAELLSTDLWTVENSGAMKPGKGDGFVAWSDIPKPILGQIDPKIIQGSPLGWRLADLSKDKQMLLRQIQAAGKMEEQKRIDAVQMTPEETEFRSAQQEATARSLQKQYEDRQRELAADRLRIKKIAVSKRR